jgi:large subunit ribosomal protein L9
MKVILLDEIKGKGREGDVVDVAHGYAVNYLLPRKLAVEATSGNLKQLKARRANIEQHESARRSDAEVIAAKLNGRRVTIEANAGEGGRLFGSVTGTMIEDAVLDQLDVDVDRKKLDIHGHIKTLGEHPIEARLHQDVRAEIVVVVVATAGEGAEAPATPKAALAAAVEAAEALETEAEEPAAPAQDEDASSTEAMDELAAEDAAEDAIEDVVVEADDEAGADETVEDVATEATEA